MTSRIFGALLIGMLVSLGSPAFAKKPKALTPAKVATLRNVAGPERVRPVTKAASREDTWLDAFVPGVEIPAKVRAAVQKEDWKAVAKGLSSGKIDPKTRPYVAFLRGYAAYKSGAPRKARKILAPLVEHGALLSDYAALYAAEAAFDAKDWHHATLHAASVPPESALHTRALFLLGRALHKAGTASDLKRAAQVYDAFLSTYRRSSYRPTVMLARADLHVERQEWDEAATLFNDIVTLHPLAGEVPRALKGIKETKRRASRKVQTRISEDTYPQYLSKMRALFKRHRSERVVEEGTRYVKKLPKRSKYACEAMFLVGRSQSKLRDHKAALPWYKRVIRECGSHEDMVMRSLYLSGRGHWNLDQDAKALASFRTLVKKFPHVSHADDAMLYIGRILRGQGKHKAARKAFKAQVAKYPKGDMAKDAHWLIVRELFAKKKYKEVLAYVAAHPDTGENDLYSRGRMAYFAARARELSGDKKGAKAAFHKVAQEHPLSYYALLSLNRMAVISPDGSKGDSEDVCALHEGSWCAFSEPEARVEIAAEIPESWKKKPSFQKGAVLLRLGIKGLAKREFRRLRRSLRKESGQLWTLAMLLDAAGAYPFSHDIPRHSIEGWKTHYPGEKNRARWEIAYPRPFEANVTKRAKERGIPSALVWAIMREESGFSPRIESWANARGLLQLMEGTAESSARRDGLKGFKRAQLFVPETNIRLGTAYMKELSGDVSGHLALIIAGYNAGFGNVGGWLEARRKLPLDLFVEDIPFGQTRNYTKRVLSSLWTYAWLQGDVRVPVLSFDLKKIGVKK